MDKLDKLMEAYIGLEEAFLTKKEYYKTDKDTPVMRRTPGSIRSVGAGVVGGALGGSIVGLKQTGNVIKKFPKSSIAGALGGAALFGGLAELRRRQRQKKSDKFHDALKKTVGMNKISKAEYKDAKVQSLARRVQRYETMGVK